MKKLRILLPVFIFLLSGCGKTTEIDELIKQTNKIQIVFNSDETKYTDITKRSEIKKFNSYISYEDTPVYKCIYDGYLIFFTDSGSVRFDFNLSDDCQHIVYEYAGALQTKKLTSKGLEYLRSIKTK